MDLTHRFTSPEDTTRFAARLAPHLGPGDVILLSGGIGAGKTHFARSLIQARLAAQGFAEDVPSPTFTLVQTYDDGLSEIWHADLYRLTHPDEVEELGLIDAFTDAICLVEWPDRLGELLPETALAIDLSATDTPNERTLHLTGPDTWSDRITAALHESPPMTDRSALIPAFLDRAGWGAATRATLAGDASNRRYERLRLGDKTAVLMDAPPEKGEDTRPFIRLAEHLLSLGLSAPAILARDTDKGLLLIEDLGDGLFARLVKADPAIEETLYFEAVEALIALHAHPAPTWVPDYGAETMTNVAGLAWDWYAKGITGQTTGRDDAQTALGKLLHEVTTDPVLVLRDYHAENLLWLPDRNGVARVGQLDFQDAGAGHPAYDLISLTEDARRDVSPDLAARMIDHYVTRTGQDPEGFTLAAATCAAQRNLRILGVFARLSMHFGKASYVDLIPRVWDHLQRNLTHPRLADLRAACASLPAPSPENLQILRDKCGTIPTL